MPSLRAPLAAALLCACAALPLTASAAGSPACAATARHASGDARIGSAVDEARRQHQLFGGQLIDRNGGLTHLGYHEAEWDRPPGDATPTWQRVAAFWRALSDSE